LSPPPSGAADAAQRCSKLYAARSLAAPSGLPASGEEPNHPAAPVAALAEGDPTPSKLKRRQRDPSIRSRIVQVRLNDDEYARIRARAEAAGVSPPRLLVELALLGPAGA